MIDVTVIIRDYLLTCPSLTSLLGTGADGSIYCSYDLPEHFDPKNGPAIQIFRAGGHSHVEIGDLVDARVQIRAWTDVEEYSLASKVYAALHDVLHGACNITTADGTLSRAIEADGPIEMTDPDTAWVAMYAFYAVMAHSAAGPTTPYVPSQGVPPNAIWAPLASPALTGTPTAPTPALADNSTRIATTAFVNEEIAAAAAPTSVPWGDLTGVPDFAAVATSGAYADLIGKPTTWAWGNLTGVPSFATVALSGAYSDLTGAPTIPAAQVNTDWNASSGLAQLLNKPTTWPWASLTGVPAFAAVATSGAYADLSGKPTIPAAQVNTDWNASSGLAQLLNKPATWAWASLTGVPAFAVVATSGAYADLSGKPTQAVTIAAASHLYLTSYSSVSGAFTSAQPAYSDLTGTPTIPAAQVNTDWNAVSGVAQLLNKPATWAWASLTGVPALAATKAAIASNWLNSYNSATGAFTATQPAASDLSNGLSGTGLVVLATSPSLVTPALGVATATSIAASGTVSAALLSVGTLQFADTNVLSLLESTVNSYNQVVLQNANIGAAASCDFIVANNLGTASTFYGDFGINSSGFTGAGSFNLPSASYLYAASGDLVLGTITANAIHFVVNNGATDSATVSAAGVWTFTSAPILPTGTVPWNFVGAAAGNLVIANAAFTTEFDQTSNVAWLWKNTTIATALTVNASPLLQLSANYWTGSASVADTWSIGSSMAAGVNAASVLSFTHTGSSGQATVMLPAGSAGKPGLQFTGASAGVGISQSAGGAAYLALSGAIDIQTAAGASALVFAPGIGSGQGILIACGYYSGGFATGQIIMCGNVGGSSVPALQFGNMNASTFIQTKGTSTGVAFGTGSGTSYGNLVWAPGSGTNNWSAVVINPGINSAAVVVTQAISSCSINTAVLATLIVPLGTSYVVGATVVVAGLTGATNTQLNGTWVVASVAAGQIQITGTGWATHAAVADSGTLTMTPGAYTALKIAVVETAVPATTNPSNKLIDCYAGVLGATPMFSVDNKGNTIQAGTHVQTATLSPTSAATAGATGQIAWDSGKIYVCVVGGAAGSATWKAAALTAV